MSFEDNDGMKFARVVDTRLEALSGKELTYVLEEGANNISYTPLTSQSHSVTNTNFNLNNIGDYTCRDGRLCLGITATLTISVKNDSADTQLLINADNFGLKQYPLNRCIQSVQHQINGASETMNNNEILDAIARMNFVSTDANFYENTMPDLIDSYGNSGSGSNYNPIASYTSSVAGEGVFHPRSLTYKIISGNEIPAGATQNVVIECSFYEPLITPFTNVSSKNQRGLYAINGEIISIVWVTDLFNNMFALQMPSGLSIASTPSVYLGASATLYTIYLTPKESTLAQIPSSSVYGYNNYSVFTNTLGSCLAGTLLNGGSVSSSVVNFTNMPSKILIYARLTNQSRTCATPDKYLRIRSLTLQFDNGSPQLSSLDLDGNQLYDISHRNGLRMPRSSFRQLNLSQGLSSLPALFGCGSVACISPAYDLGIKENLSAASGGRFIFQVQNASFENATITDFANVTFYVVGITSAVLERVGNQYRNYLMLAPPDAVLRSRDLEPISHQAYIDAKFSNSFMSGGWSPLDVGKWLYDKGKKVVEKLPEIIDTGKKVYGAYKDVRSLTGRGGQSRLFN